MGKVTPDTETKRTDARYWLYEEPEYYETGKNALRYYPQAGKLQINACDYVVAHRDRFFDSMVEERKPGKPCALDLNALYEDQETLSWLISILEGLKAQES